MVIADGGQLSGPIKDILDEAAASMGLTIAWQIVPFARSLDDLHNGAPVIVPRVLRTADRETFVRYLGPIAVQHRIVRFAARPDRAVAIRGYEDLKSLKIATLRGTATFPEFDSDGSLDKQLMTDDVARVRLLEARRVDAIISIDQRTLSLAFQAIKFTDWAWAPYEVTMDGGNYYGISRNGPLARRADALDRALQRLVETGRVREIYLAYGLDPNSIAD